jgi:hypothetical protein
MCTFLFIVGALMGTCVCVEADLLQKTDLFSAVYGHNLPGPQTATSYVITGHQSATYGIIVCSYFFVCSYASSEWRMLRLVLSMLIHTLDSLGTVSPACSVD